MEQLNTYINSHPRNERQAVKQRLAKACSVTVTAVTHWANGTKSPGKDKLVKLHLATGRKVSLEAMLPDAELLAEG